MVNTNTPATTAAKKPAAPRDPGVPKADATHTWVALGEGYENSPYFMNEASATKAAKIQVDQDGYDWALVAQIVRKINKGKAVMKPIVKA